MFSVMSTQQRWVSLLMAVGLSLPLTLFFLPLVRWVCKPPFDLIGFPVLALLFYSTVARRVKETPSPPRKGYLRSLLPAVVVSAVAGALFPQPSLLDLAKAGHFFPVLWVLFAAPLGEELLFRGWLYAVFQARYGHSVPWATNPLPMAVWASALGFSLWHLQNVPAYPALGLAQVVYTFWTGVWLGYLRLRSSSLLLPIVAHSALNLAFGLF